MPPLARRLHVDPADAVPLWSQVEQSLRRLIAAGALEAGAPVPSVRELARDLRINPATVSKAYQRLAEAGVLDVRRGDGTYVGMGSPSLSRHARAAAVREAAIRYASVALTSGLGREEALDELRAAWAGLSAKEKGEGR